MNKTVLTLSIGIIMLLVPIFSHAQGPGPSFFCVMIAPSPPVHKGGRPPGTVPCQEPSPCGPVPGVCMRNGLGCKAITPPSCAGNKGALDQGLQALQGLIGKALEALKKKGGGGGGGGQPPPQNFLGNQEKQPEPTTVDTLIRNITSTGTPSDTQSDILDGAFNIIDFSDDELQEDTDTTIENVSQESGVKESDVDSESSSGGTTTPVTVVDDNTQVSESGGEATLSTEFVDEETGTGVAGFFGFSDPALKTPQEQEGSIVGRLCTARPWEGSLVARLFSSRFFDSVCESRGFVPGGHDQAQDVSDFATSIIEGEEGAQLSCSPRVTLGETATLEWSCGEGVQSGGINFTTGGWATGERRVHPTEDTTYTLECATGERKSCTVQVVAPEVQITAHPQRVPLGARTQIFWSGNNVESCAVTGPGLREEAISGSAITGAVLDVTTFTVTCETEDGVVVIAETTVEVGI